MILIDHAAFDERSIGENLGAAEYSYWFVRKAFQRVLKGMGTVVSVVDPAIEVDQIFEAARARGEPCAFLSFNPPRYVPTQLACPTIPVFAWEYDRIPDEAWGDNPGEDWRVALEDCGAAITHSQYAARAVRKAMGDSFRVWSIPAPVFEPNRGPARSTAWHVSRSVSFEGGIVIDSRRVDLSLFRGDKVSLRTVRALHRILNEPSAMPVDLDITGVVYTTVFNPADRRKNWQDLIAGFIWAFRHNADATLCLKITHSGIWDGLIPVLTALNNMGSYQCRIVVIQGMLSDSSYRDLMNVTTYVVNSSHGEGQCLPLMEFMSGGCPAIAPLHTAMVEYLTPDNGFPIGSSSRLVHWPHDPRSARRCRQRDIDFTQLVGAFSESYRVARDEPETYESMSGAAVKALANFCSDETVTDRLSDVLLAVTGHRPEMPSRTPPVAVQADEIAGRDAEMAGWFQPDGLLYHGFPVSRGDTVLADAEDEKVSSFCVEQGASVDRIDPTTDKLAVADGSMSRIVCLDALSRASDPGRLLAELYRIGRPGALYLLSVPSTFKKAMIIAADPSSGGDFDTVGPEELRRLIEDAGLSIEHETTDGFFKSLRDAFSAGRTDDSDPNAADGWAATWAHMLAASDDGLIRKLWDDKLPGRHLFVAAKLEQAAPPRSAPVIAGRWSETWPLPDMARFERTDPFMQGVRDTVLIGWYNSESGELAPGFQVSPEDVVLDFGCGGGGFAGFCANMGAHVILADVDAAAAEEQKAFLSRRTAKPVEALVTDGDPLLLPDASVSRIICTEVLEHVEDPHTIISELVRVGKPGAKYLLTVPTAAVEDIQRQIGPADYFRPPNHVRVFADGELAKFARQAGLTVERDSGDGFFWSLGLFLIWTKGVRPGARSPLLDLWGATWKMVLDMPNGMALKQVLDSFMPKRQVVIATKPDRS